MATKIYTSFADYMAAKSTLKSTDNVTVKDDSLTANQIATLAGGGNSPLVDSIRVKNAALNWDQFSVAQTKLNTADSITVADTAATLQANLGSLLANSKVDTINTTGNGAINLTTDQAINAAYMEKLQIADNVQVNVSSTTNLTPVQATALYANPKIDDVVNLYNFSSSATQVTEGKSIVFTVNAQIPVQADTSFNYSVLPNSSVFQAIDGTDLTPLSGTVTIKEGAKSGTFTIDAINDGTIEFNEGAKVILTDSTGATVGTAKSFVIQDAATAPVNNNAVQSTFTANAQDTIQGNGANNELRAEMTNSNNVSATNTLTAGDYADGKGGTDRVILTATDSLSGVAAQLTGFQFDAIEELEIRAFDADGNGIPDGEVDLGLINVSGLNKVISNKSTADIKLDYVNNIVDLELTGNGKIGAGITVDYLSDTIDGIQTQNITLKNFGENGRSGRVDVNGVETFAIATQDKSSFAGLRGDSVSAITLDLQQDLTITDYSLDIVNKLTSVRGIDTMPGALTTDLSASGRNLSIKTGQGSDNITTGQGDDTIVTGGGNDIVNAGGAIPPSFDNFGNLIKKNGGNNIDVGDGNNRVDATGGDDTVNAGDGNDIIKVGEGNNTVAAGKGANDITTGAGSDRITSGTGNDTINSGNGNDTIEAGSGNNVITLGGNGFHNVTTLEGNDAFNVPGQLAVNTIGAGNGNDTINTQFNNANGANSFSNITSVETLVFNTPSDGILNANNGANKTGVTTYVFEGGIQNTAVNLNKVVNNINVKLHSNTAAADLSISHSTDTPADVLNIDASDALASGTQLNSLTLANTETLNLTGNDNLAIDTLTLQSIDPKITDPQLNKNTIKTINATSVTGDLTLPNIDNNNQAMIINSGSGNDLIRASGGNDTLNGGNGSDALDGGEGNDSITGGSGNDSIVAGTGVDVLDGGTGNDTFVFTYSTETGKEGLTSADIVSGGEGNDTVQIKGDTILPDGVYYQWTGIEALDVSDGNGKDEVTLNVIAKHAGLNTITTGSGNDLVSLGEGFDTELTVKLSGGDDQVLASVNAILTVEADASNIDNMDILTGGDAGNDTLQIDADNGIATLGDVTKFETVKITGTINDATVIINNSKVIDAGKTLTVDASSLVAPAGVANGHVIFDGSKENDSFNVTGSNGADSITTGSANDTIDAGQGNDIIAGGAGKDTLLGNSGSDVLTGGLGTDKLTGGDGNDTFVIGNTDSPYTANAGAATADVITDFNAGEFVDRLQLGTAATAVVTGANGNALVANYSEATIAVVDFVAAAKDANTMLTTLAQGHAVNANIEAYNFQWDNTNGYLFDDTDGNGSFDQVIVLTGINGNLISDANIIA